MPYELHIKRNESVTSEEWLSVVESTDEIKIDDSDWVAINPATGQEIKLPGSPETAALWFPNLKKWIKIFRWRRGRISFNANDWDDPQSPVRAKAVELAQKLNAEIIGDEGEKY